MTDISVRLQNLIEADPDPAMVEFYTTCLREIDRLRAIEDAAIDAASYFHLGGCGEEDFDPPRMGNLMTKLGRALEPKQ